MFWKGLQFGMLLQLAIGPLCLYIFDQASTQGFLAAWVGVWAITLGDGVFILGAVFGLDRFARQASRQVVLQYLGPAIVFILGLTMVLSGFGISVFSDLKFAFKFGGVFITALLLTLSSPMTFLFWAGVFSVRVAAHQLSRPEMSVFAAGAFVSTPVFMTLIAFAGTLVHRFLSNPVIAIINALVGLFLVGLAVQAGLKIRNTAVETS